jgi:AraC-like DNA-binding protein
MKKKTDTPKGVLLKAHTASGVKHQRFYPSPDLAYFIEHFWKVSWDRTGKKPLDVETLPHPTVHLVFEKNATRIAGVQAGKFTQQLKGKGFVFSVKFRPGAFLCFYTKSIKTLTHQQIHPATFWGDDFDKLEQNILSASSDKKRFDLLTQFLRSRKPKKIKEVALVNELLQKIKDEQILKVNQLSDRSAIGVRQLNRLFLIYLGVNPKWVIMRYRIHEVIEKLHSKAKPDWISIAYDFGYADQAHFNRDFKKIIGKTPSSYIQSLKKR